MFHYMMTRPQIQDILASENLQNVMRCSFSKMYTLCIVFHIKIISAAQKSTGFAKSK